MSGGNGDDQLWFTIGSVDTFERNLENAQLDLQVDPSRFLPVLYKSQLELSNVISSLPTLLILAFIFWSFRRAGTMMGGKSGGRGGGTQYQELLGALALKSLNLIAKFNNHSGKFQ
jgi:AFG3 family protein